MSSQIFKNPVPNEKLIELLNKICQKTDNYYLFNLISFKKGLFTQDIPEFISFCIPYYYLSKRKYLERKMTYTHFTTILRQICNFNKIAYTSNIKYDKSNYNIEYIIYF